MKRKNLLKSNKPTPKVLEMLKLATIVPASAEMPSVRQICKRKLGGPMPERYIGDEEDENCIFAPPEYVSAVKIIAHTILREHEKYLLLFAMLKEFKERALAFYDSPGATRTLRNPTHDPSEKIRHLEDLIDYYRHIRDRRLKIYSIAQHAKLYYEMNAAQIPVIADEYFPVYPSYLSIQGDFIIFKKDPVAEAFEGVDARRIRLCESCGTIFWAYRLGNHTCSIKCANNRRQRLHRAKTRKLKNLRTENENDGTL